MDSKVQSRKPLLNVVLPSRSIQDATPALLPFLSFIKPWPSIKVYLHLNSLDGLERSTLPELFGEDALCIIHNPHTIENCENSWPLFMVNVLRRFRTDLQSEMPDISTTCVMYLNDDIYLDGIDVIMEEIINGRVTDTAAIAPTINPLYDRKGDWHKGTMRYFDWWGLVTTGSWLSSLVIALGFLCSSNITVGSGPLATAKVVGERNGKIIRLEGATAHLLRETTSKAGQVENSLNMLACAMFQGNSF